MNGPERAFPLVESSHFIGFALSFATIAIVDLRLPGIAMRWLNASELDADLHMWTWFGFAVMLTSGPLMFSADAVNYHHNLAFQFKNDLPVVRPCIPLHGAPHRDPRFGPTVTGKARGAASLALWTSVVAGGRMIAFV